MRNTLFAKCTTFVEVVEKIMLLMVSSVSSVTVVATESSTRREIANCSNTKLAENVYFNIEHSFTF